MIVLLVCERRLDGLTALLLAFDEMELQLSTAGIQGKVDFLLLVETQEGLETALPPMEQKSLPIQMIDKYSEQLTFSSRKSRLVAD